MHCQWKKKVVMYVILNNVGLVTVLTTIRISYCLFSFLTVMDVQAFERLLGPCMEIMKRNIANYEEQLVALFGTNMDISDPSS